MVWWIIGGIWAVSTIASIIIMCIEIRKASDEDYYE